MAEHGIRQMNQKKSPWNANKIGRAILTVGAEAALAANAIDVAVTLKAGNGHAALAERVGLKWYLSDDAEGDGLTASAPNGGTAAGAEGTVIEDVAETSGFLVTNASGAVNVRITHSSTGTWYLILILPDGSVVPSGAITFV